MSHVSPPPLPRPSPRAPHNHNKLRKPRLPHVSTHVQPLSFSFTDLNLDLSLGPSTSRPIPVSSIATTTTTTTTATTTTTTTTLASTAPCSPSRPLHSSPLTSPTSSTHGGSFSSSRSNASLSRSNTSTSPRKLTKRRPSLLATIPQARPVPPSSSEEAAYAAASALLHQPHPTTFLMDHSPPSYTQSDIGHGANLTPKRGSIIRRFSMLSKKQAQDSASSSSLAPWPESAARAKWTRWKKTKGTEQVDSEQRPSLPLLRVISPFSVSMPEQSPHRHTDIRGNGMKLSLQEDGPSSPPPTADPLSLMPGSASPPATDKDSPTRPRPKFTLSNESDADLSSDQHLSPCSSFSHPPPRPRLVRRDANVGSVGYGTQRRRWTLAMAMTDEDITDEVLVEELERVVLRMNSHWTGSLEDIPAGFGIWDAEIGRELWESSLESYFGRDGDTSDAGHSTEANPWPDRLIVNESPTSESGLPIGAKIPFTPSLPSFPLQHRLSTPAPASTATWQTARRALLTCRELVRTERHYLHSLQSLLASETKTPPPLLMLHYAGELVKISEGLLGRMEENPSAWGVAAAFLGKEEGVETAFVSWCGVVGTWFVDDDKADADRGRGSSRSASRKSSPVRRKLSKPSIADDKDKKAEADEDATLMSPLMRTVSTWRKSMPSISSMNESVGGSSGSQLSSSYFLSKRKEKERERNVSASSLTPPTTQGSSKRKPAVRDLAILPTQRVMRYVLLYRDLLAHTPSTSPSRALVERAVEAACRVAQKCDRAQGNAVFFSGSAPKVDTSNKVAGDSSSSSSIAPGARPSSRRKITLSMTPMTSRSRADQNAEL